MTSEGYCVRFSTPPLRSLNCLPQARQTEPAIALGGALRSLRHSFRSAFQAPHLRPPRCERRPYTQPSPCQPEALARALTEPHLGLTVVGAMKGAFDAAAAQAERSVAP